MDLAVAATRGVEVVRIEVEVVSEAAMIGTEATLEETEVVLDETGVALGAAGPARRRGSVTEATVADGEAPLAISEIHMFRVGGGATRYLAGLDPDLALDRSLLARLRPALARAAPASTEADGPPLVHAALRDDDAQDLGPSPHHLAGMRPSVAALHFQNPAVVVVPDPRHRIAVLHRPNAVATLRPGAGAGVVAAAQAGA